MARKIIIIANKSDGLYGFRKELIQRLISDGSEVIALTPFDDKVEELKDIGVILYETPIDRRGINPITDLGLMRNYYSLLKKIKPDLVITYTIKPNIYGGLASGFFNIPYATNITGLGTAFQKKGALRLLVVSLYKFALKKAKVVFFENVGNKQTLIEEKVVKEEQCCVLNGAGVNLEQYQYAEYPENGNTTRFLFIGRVMKEKGIDELFEAMKKLNSDGYKCELDVLGGYEEDYAEFIRAYETEGWLHYHGYQKDVKTFIEKAHCFVLPSWHEGMANTNLECAAMGRPVITSNIHGCKEAVEDGVSGFLCERKDAGSLFEVMKKFCQLDVAMRRQMGLASRKRMKDVFDKKLVVQKTVTNLELM